MTNDNYIGITTGTVATACSLAALDAILDSSDIACVKVETPKKTLDIIIDECKKLSPTKAYAVAHKNPYNDPDVTVYCHGTLSKLLNLHVLQFLSM